MQTLHNYSKRIHLVKEMFDTCDIIRRFDEEVVQLIYRKIRNHPAIMLTGEGSSRIFPAKNMIAHRLLGNTGPLVLTEGSNDLAGKDLSGFAVFGTSNSGQTKELVSLFMELSLQGHKNLYGLTCNKDTLLEKYSRHVVILDTGKEQAVAATKSVVAQALFYDYLISQWTGKTPGRALLADLFEQTLGAPFDQNITRIMAAADHVYFAGDNNGVAEELALKTNETIRKKSAYWPGTFLFHGVEEVVTEKDVIVLVDYLPEHEGKIRQVYLNSVGATVVVFYHEQTPFPTVPVFLGDSYNSPYIKLAAGWRILAESGIFMGVDLDKPKRARKIGYEF